MRDPKRIDELLAEVSRVWKQYPDMRLGQLLIVAANEEHDIFNVEDDKMLKGLRFLQKRFAKTGEERA